MVTTRSMHGTSKKTDCKISVNQKAAKRPSKRAKSPRTEKVDGKFHGESNVIEDDYEWTKGGFTLVEWTVDDDAFTIFMKNDYLKKYYKSCPPPINGVTPFEVDCAGQLKWRGMTTKDKAPFLELARKMRAEGRSFFSL